MTRTGIRIVRLIRRRRFKYRRLHRWRLDVVAVVVLFSAGWFFFPPFDGPRAGRTPEAFGMAIREQSRSPADQAVISPAIFAFTTREGFAHGVVAAHLEALGGQIPLAPPGLESDPATLESVGNRGFRRPGGGRFDRLNVPPPPKVERGISGERPLSRGARVWASIPGFVPDGHFNSCFESPGGGRLRIYVHFNETGRADSAVLFPSRLGADVAACVERAAMRLKGPENTAAWILLRRDGERSML